MKIQKVLTHILRHKLEHPFQSAFSTFHDRSACLVENCVRQRAYRLGECLGPPLPNAATVQTMSVCWSDAVVGYRADLVEPVRSIPRSGSARCLHDRLERIDIALWDIAGKYFDVPIHVLLGGAHRTDVPAYATGGFRPVGKDRKDAVIDEVAGYVSAGFSAVKIKIGFGVAEDCEVIFGVREAIGPDIALMIDANHGFDIIEAIDLAKRVESYGISWLRNRLSRKIWKPIETFG